MKIFLTSSPCMADSDALNPANGFVEKLRQDIKPGSRGLFIASSPSDYGQTEFYALETRKSFAEAGIVFSDYSVLDERNAASAPKLVASADVIILAGGHVPTQNAFFQRISLRDCLASFRGTLIGISAGTMNSADVVYTHAELPGEATDPNYKKFLPGLGLTKTQVIPHYQFIKDQTLDGLRLFEDVAYPDSLGRSFVAMPDGSYIYIADGRETLFGEAWLISSGSLSKLSNPGDITKLH